MPDITFYRSNDRTPLTKTHSIIDGKYQQMNFMAGANLSSRTVEYETLNNLLAAMGRDPNFRVPPARTH